MTDTNETYWDPSDPILAAHDAARQAELVEALRTMSDICRGLRRCRHGRSCCRENDNTVGAVNEAVRVIDAILSKYPKAAKEDK